MKKRLLTILTVIFALVLGLAVLAACGGDDEGGDSEGISINVSSASISVGEEKTLMVSSKNKTYTWTTSDDAVVGFSGATNRSTVRIKGVGKGEATVTATDGDGKRATCAVTVDEFKVEITGDGLANGKITLLRNSDGSYESKTLTAKVLRSGTATDEAVTWGSSAPAVVSVENGVLTAHGMGTATVTAKRTGGSAQSSVEVEVKWGEGAAPVGWYEILHGGENLSLGENAGKWVWTGDEGWGASTPTVTGDGLGDGSVTLNVEGNTGWRWYGVQLFYKNASLTAGTVYKLTFDVNSTEAGWITVNDTDVEIKKGTNSVTVYYVEGAGDTASIHMNLATHDKLRNGVNPINQYPQGTLSLTNLKWEPYTAQKLAAPTEFSVEADGELKITDTNNDADFEGYVIGFFKEGKAEPSYTQPIMKPVEGRDILATMNVKDGKMYLDDSFVPAGTYTLKVYAYSNSATHQNSDWSSVSVTRTVTHENGLDYDILESYRDVDRGIGRYYVWSEWELFNLEQSYYRDNTLTLAITGAGSWYSNQLYYEPKPGEFLEDHLYEFTFTLSAKDNEGNDVDLTNRQFIVAGQRVNTTTGTHDYTVRFYYFGGNFTMLFGKPSEDWQGDSEDGGSLEAGIYKFSNMQFKDLSDPETNPAMFFGTDKNLDDNPDRFIYWYAASSDLTFAQELGGTMAGGATMRSMSTTPNSESVTGYSHTFDYKVDPIEGKNCVWIVRFWYKNTQLDGGKEYHVVLSITSDEEGDILVNKEKVHITTGTHDYLIYYDGTDQTLLAINMATDDTMMGADADGIRVTFNSIKWVEGGIQKLTVPTGSVAQDGTVTFTDPNNGTGVDHFELGLFEGETLVSTQTIADGGKIDDSKHYNGTYIVKLRACGTAGYRDSDWTQISESYTVTNGMTGARLGGNSDAVDNPNNWYVWADDNWTGSKVTLTKNDLDLENKRLTIAYTTEGVSTQNPFSVQVFYENSSLTSYQNYTLTVTLKLSVAGTITLNGTKITFTANEEKTVRIAYLERDYEGKYNEGSSFNMQMGASDTGPVSAAELVISSWSWDNLEQKNLQTPTNFAIGADNKVSFTDPNNGVGVGSFQLGYFIGDTMYQTVTVTEGATLDTSKVFRGTYSVKLQAIGSTLEYIASGWSNPVTKEVTTDPAYDMSNKTEEQAPKFELVHFAEIDNVATARFDNGTVTLTLTGPGNNWYSNQLFYKFNSNENGYKLTLKLNSTTAGKIRVNGEDKDIVVGDNTIEVKSTFLGLSLQMAAYGGNSLGAGTYTFSEFKWEKDGHSCSFDGRFQ